MYSFDISQLFKIHGMKGVGGGGALCSDSPYKDDL